MISRVVHQLILCLLSFSLVLAQGGPSSADRVSKSSSGKKKHHTKVSLVSSVKTIKPGGRFTVGVLMTMDPGWHTYWKNGGEAGLPTEVTWKLPQGFTMGEIQWPVPHKYNESGEVLTYGYADENMLLVDIAAPASLNPGATVALHADVEWLECEHICVPGSASVDLKLRVSSADPLPDNAALFAKYTSRISPAFSDRTEFTFTTALENGSVEVRLNIRDGQSLVVQKDTLPDLYPEPIDQHVMISRTVVDATPDEALLRVPLSALEKLSGPLTFRGVVVYQMKGGERKSAVIEVPLTTEFCASLPVAGEEPAAGSVLDRNFSTVETPGTGQSLYLYLIFAFVGGLLLNVMPCVLPVIALKIFGLMQMAGDHPRQVKKLGWFFSLGILASFLVLALLVVVLQAAGEQVGWGFQFQEPLFVITMCVVVFAFGLSLFGVYEVSLPFMSAFVGSGSALEKKDEKGGKGYAASFVEGVFATILATPCTAPFLGTALGFAFSQPPGIILLIFTTVACGMALPYLVLTAKPAWMKFLPRPGEWMVSVKQFMGFLMMATLVWLLYVLGKQLGMEAVVWTLAFLLTVGIACWVVGRFATLNATRRKYITTWGVAIVVVVVGYWVFLVTILDVRSVIAGVPSTVQPAPTNDSHGIQWQPFSLEKLSADLQSNKTVFIDFTADWCLTCKVNEKSVLADQDVIQRF
ncbi:MAG: protein-disulfide reductase DsbD domain-containing protein, partial [Bacteroidota bacterium]